MGRPRFRWLEDVESNLRRMKLKKRRQQANNREKCPSVLVAQVLKSSVQPKSNYLLILLVSPCCCCCCCYCYYHYIFNFTPHCKVNCSGASFKPCPWSSSHKNFMKMHFMFNWFLRLCIREHVCCVSRTVVFCSSALKFYQECLLDPSEIIFTGFQ
jgi:hypothetical protein